MLIDFRTLFPKYNIKPKGVLHVGANIGEEAPVYHQLGVENVAWFEANPEIFERLKTNLSDYPNQIAYNYAIGDKNEKVVLHVSNNGSQSSSVLELGTHKTQHPEVFYTHDVEVEMRTLDGFKFPFEMDFLNMDIQGYELHALKGMGDMIKDFKWVYIEVNKQELYKGCGLYDDIVIYLGAYGLYPVESKWVGGWGDTFFTR
jgi:FkbM family methyltransferase